MAAASWLALAARLLKRAPSHFPLYVNSISAAASPERLRLPVSASVLGSAKTAPQIYFRYRISAVALLITLAAVWSCEWVRLL